MQAPEGGSKMAQKQGSLVEELERALLLNSQRDLVETTDW